MLKNAFIVLLFLSGSARAAFDFGPCSQRLRGENDLTPLLIRNAQAHHAAMLEELQELIRIPSMSVTPENAPDLLQAANRVEQLFTGLGLEVERKQLPGSAPFFLISSPNPKPHQPTVLGYAHYDVVPPNGEWSVTKAFEPRIVDGRLYGRGAGDNKGGIVLFAAAIQPLLEHYRALGQDLPFNFRLVVEGEEENGSPHFQALTKSVPDFFSGVDVVISPDGVNHQAETPSVITNTRGFYVATVRVRVSDSAAHSGLAGGAFPIAQNALTIAFARMLHPTTGRFDIAGLPTPSSAGPSELASVASLGDGEEAFRANMAIRPSVAVLRHPGESIQTLIARGYSFSLFDLKGSTDMPTSLAPYAEAKFSIRVPPGAMPDQITAALENHFRTQLPWGELESLTVHSGTKAWSVDSENPAVQLVGQALARGYGQQNALFMGNGGSLSLMNTLEVATGGAPSMLIGIDDPDTRIHGLDENLHLATFVGNRNGLIHLFDSLGHAKPATP